MGTIVNNNTQFQSFLQTTNCCIGNMGGEISDARDIGSDCVEELFNENNYVSNLYQSIANYIPVGTVIAPQASGMVTLDFSNLDVNSLSINTTITITVNVNNVIITLLTINGNFLGSSLSSLLTFISVAFNALSNGYTSTNTSTKISITAPLSLGSTVFTATTLIYATDVANILKKIDLTAEGGAYPYSGLVLADNGLYYGVCSQGGLNDIGTIYSYNVITNTFINVYDFDGTNGNDARGRLVKVPNGSLYGITVAGGVNGLGVIFEFNPTTNTYTNKYDIAVAESTMALSGMTLARSGNLYGCSSLGGVNNLGTIFEFDYVTSDYYLKLSGSIANGYRGSVNELIQATNDKLYGVTYFGGSNNNGTIFEFNPATDTHIVLYDFSFIGLEGDSPVTTLIQAANDKLYGITEAGGVNGFGVIFEYDIDTSAYIKKIDLTSTIQLSSGLTGFIEPVLGILYCNTLVGSNGQGGILKYDYINNIYTEPASLYGNDGVNPFSILTLASDGYLYGTTNIGGINDYGTIFQFRFVDYTFIANGQFIGGSTLTIQQLTDNCLTSTEVQTVVDKIKNHCGCCDDISQTALPIAYNPFLVTLAGLVTLSGAYLLTLSENTILPL